MAEDVPHNALGIVPQTSVPVASAMDHAFGDSQGFVFLTCALSRRLVTQEETSNRHQCQSDYLTIERQVPKQASAFPSQRLTAEEGSTTPSSRDQLSFERCCTALLPTFSRRDSTPNSRSTKKRLFTKPFVPFQEPGLVLDPPRIIVRWTGSVRCRHQQSPNPGFTNSILRLLYWSCYLLRTKKTQLHLHQKKKLHQKTLRDRIPILT